MTDGHMVQEVASNWPETSALNYGLGLVSFSYQGVPAIKHGGERLYFSRIYRAELHCTQATSLDSVLSCFGAPSEASGSSPSATLMGELPLKFSPISLIITARSPAPETPSPTSPPTALSMSCSASTRLTGTLGTNLLLRLSFATPLRELSS
jgi:hypothetical protein